jgi:hypothetical protein
MLSPSNNRRDLFEMRLVKLEKLVEGPPGIVTLVQLNIHSAPAGGQQLLDEANKNLYEAF